MKKFIFDHWHFLTIILMLSWLVCYLANELAQSRANEVELSRRLYMVGKTGQPR